MLIIDTHAHIYSPDERKYPPIEKPLRVPGGKGSLEDLRQESAEHGVRGVCLIQTSTFYRFDNRYVCDSALSAKPWAAGVCTLDPDDPHSPGLLKHYVQKFGIRGIRSIPAKDGRLDHPGVRALWKAALESDIVVNVLIGREKAPELARLLGQFSRLPVVLDHCLNLKAGPEMSQTLDAVLRLARFRNLHAKLTFLATGSLSGYPCDDLHGPCLKIVQAYGAERCVWGSDFPLELWAPRLTYAEHLRIFQRDLPLPEEDRKKILGETARRLWFRSASF
ncbi:MAG: amidohydrolase [Bryobacteraceae bacterium]|nr:amidohydrolase [Bryobacteraceae bacterium]MDW8379409.1 amidohydrolase family protein [Bryobacterales bacterium]